LLALHLSCGALSCAQPAGKPADLPPITTRIAGTVRDDATGLPLAGAAVHSEPPTESLTTGADGAFALQQGITPRTVYRITAAKAGYLPAQAGFATVEGNTTQVDLTLVPAKPQLAASRDTLDFGAFDTTASFAVSNAGDAEAPLSFQATSAAAWVKGLTPASGALDHPAVVKVELDRSKLGTPYGVRSGTVELTSNGGARTVALRVDNPDPAKPYLAVSPQHLDFGLAGVERTLVLRNAGSGTLHWKATPARPWVTVSKTSGDLPFGPFESLTVSVDRSLLPEGHGTSTLSFTATDGAAQPQSVELVFEVGGAPITAVEPALADFGAASSTVTFSVRNAGYGTLSYQLEPPAVNWFTVKDPPPATWQTLGAGQRRAVTLSLVPDTLPPGVHFAPLVVRSDQNLPGQQVAGGNRTVTVRAECCAANAPRLEVSTTSVDLGSEGTGTITLTNTGWGVASYAVTSKPAWLSVTPAAADIVTPFQTPPQSQQVVLSVDRTGLGLGHYSGSVHFSSAAGEHDVAVTMTVAGFLWTRRAGGGAPPARSQTALTEVLGLGSGRSFALYGGLSGGNWQGDTWSFDFDAGWRQETTNGTPGVRGPARFMGASGSVCPILYGGGPLGYAADRAFPWYLNCRFADAFHWEVLLTCATDPSKPLSAAPCAADANSGVSRVGMQRTSNGVVVYYGGLDVAGTRALATVSRQYDLRADVGTLPRPLLDAVPLEYPSGTSNLVLLVGTPCSNSDPATCTGMTLMRGPSVGYSGNGYAFTEEKVGASVQRTGAAAFILDGAIYLFGGYDSTGALTQSLLRVTTDGKVAPVPTFGTLPPARANAGLAVNSNSGKGVLFGGTDGTSDLGDTWILERFQ
jgi:hypothetical protein